MNRKLDIMSVLGWVIGFFLMFLGCTVSENYVEGGFNFTPGNIRSFYDTASIIIVFGGTVCALMLSYPGSQLAKVPQHLKIILSPMRYDPMAYITQLVEFARKARINGLLALEEDLENIDDAFLKSSMLMVVDSIDPEKVKQQLESRLEHLDDRHAQESGFYFKGAGYAPAFGMIGTLIGLINLLKDLQDSASIGPNMAVALITTFYGTVLANLIFTPIGNKLQARHEEEYLCDMIICEGVQAIQAGENPKFIQERLVNLLPQYKQELYTDSSGETEGEGGGGGGGGRRR